jgi:hypothetical protein
VPEFARFLPTHDQLDPSCSDRSDRTIRPLAPRPIWAHDTLPVNHGSSRTFEGRVSGFGRSAGRQSGRPSPRTTRRASRERSSSRSCSRPKRPKSRRASR